MSDSMADVWKKACREAEAERDKLLLQLSEERERCCRLLCNSCSQGIAVEYSEKAKPTFRGTTPVYGWVHLIDCEWDWCHAAKLREIEKPKCPRCLISGRPEAHETECLDKR